VLLCGEFQGEIQVGGRGLMDFCSLKAEPYAPTGATRIDDDDEGRAE